MSIRFYKIAIKDNEIDIDISQANKISGYIISGDCKFAYVVTNKSLKICRNIEKIVNNYDIEFITFLFASLDIDD